MEAELVALATSGATTLVGLMVTEVWSEVRGRFGALFGRRRETVCEDMDAVREELIAAEDREAAMAGAEAEWTARLRRALAADPAAADQLRSLLDELQQHGPQPGAGSANATITGGTFHQSVVQIGRIDQAGDVTF
ncbi:hypothetical protein [Kitasatospora sp. NPDC094015]|uniref:hypothetical protein n=1 Tax=Kitasatospora sp. NPDC094015 TaxID=3155205 RepID=UPI0033302E79